MARDVLLCLNQTSKHISLTDVLHAPVRRIVCSFLAGESAPTSVFIFLSEIKAAAVCTSVLPNQMCRRISVLLITGVAKKFCPCFFLST